MADEVKPSAHASVRPTGKRQLTGVSTTSNGGVERNIAHSSSDGEKSTNKVASFFPEVVAEMKKVIWPTSKQMINYTLIVFGFLIVMTALVWGIDALTRMGVSFILTP